MKKAFLMIAMALACACAFAQPKSAAPAKDTTKKAESPRPPQFNPDAVAGKNIHAVFNLKLRSYQLNDYFLYEQYGQDALENSDRVTARQVTLIKKNHQAVADSIRAALYRQYDTFMNAEKKRFDDSVARIKPAGK